MRRLALGLALWGSIVSAPVLLSASNVKGISVAGLEQKLASERGKADVDVAQQLSGVELTERLSAATVARLAMNAPGPKTAQALKILADESAFLPLPSGEIPTPAAPNFAEQRAMMALVVTYVSKTIHQLPNFSATRITTQFEETPQVAEGTFTVPYKPLHVVSTDEEAVHYRDGQEVVDSGKVKAGAEKTPTKGLSEWGVFGPILSMVFVDAAKSSLSWGHWEKGASGSLAVFKYAVPLANSHYRATYCCFAGGGPTSAFDRVVGYHGELTVEPADGAILRLTVEAELRPLDPVSVVNIMVEYGPVEIGAKSYICATRSVALSAAVLPSRFGGDWKRVGQVEPAELGPTQKRLNDVVFERYHVFRAESRILTGEVMSDQPEPAAGAAASTAEASAPAPTQAPASAPAEAPVEQAAVQTVASTAPVRKTDDAAGAAPVDQVAVLKVSTREVIVDVVSTRGDGQPLLGLTKTDFAVKEDGKVQSVNFFEEHTQSGARASAPPEMPLLPPGTPTNVPAATPGESLNVVLIDTLNSEVQDQERVISQVRAFLKQMPPGTRMAIFVLGSKLRCLQSFTSDPSVLLAAVNDPKNGLKTEKSAVFESRGDQSLDADSVAALQAMRASAAGIDAMNEATGNSSGNKIEVRAALTYQALVYLGRYLSGIPGRKSLIWFASTFPVTVFPSAEDLSRQKKNGKEGDLDRFKVTADLYTASKVAVYPIGAEGVLVDHAMGSDQPFMPSARGPVVMIGSGNAAAMEQLAGSTGGEAFYNTNDLAGALKSAVQDGTNYYTVGYSPANKELDGSFRRVDIALVHGRSKLAYRHGYFATDHTKPASAIGGDPLAPLLRIGLPGTTGILYGVHAEAAAAQPEPGAHFAGQNLRLGGATTRYTVSFVVRAQDLNLQPDDKGLRRGKFLLGLKAFDQNGKPLNWEAHEEDVEIAPEQLDLVRKDGLTAQVEIDLPKAGAVRLVTAVYDLNGSNAGTLEIPLDGVGR